MISENALIARVCHDLITPFNAINLGIEAFIMSEDRILLDEVKKSVDKANGILKFIRELYTNRSSDSCYPIIALKKMISDFLQKYNILPELQSEFENIPNIVGKIIMYNAILAKEIMPFGGKVRIKIDNNSNEIATVCSGRNIALPDMNIEELNHKNVMRFKLLQLLKELKFEVTTYREDDQVIIREQLC